MAARTPVKKKAKTKPETAARAKVAAKRGTAARLAARPKATAKPKALSAEMAKFREQLVAELARLEGELDEIERRTARLDESDRASELSAYEDHPADLASETFEREKDLAIGESVEHLLHKVVGAIEKIDKGTYGLCDACGRPIKKARLKALPFATLCLECQDRLER
ncbi:MAG: TraR/DksA C4-type zinc finger protein [Armatimonadota bacterium]